MIKGEKCFLTAVNPDSIETLRNWRINPKLRRYFREFREISKPMQESWYRDRVLNNPNQFDFEIRDKETGSLIGHCGLYYVNWVSRSAEFTIYIGDFSFRGQGIGSDALRSLIRYGFDDLNLNRIWCEVYSNNDAIHIYEKIGFIKEGVMRDQYYSEGKYWDSTILSMLSSDWKKELS